MDNDERITQLETQIERLAERQAELHKELASAQLDHWKGRVDDLEVQLHLAAMDANEKVGELLQQLRHSWAAGKAQIERRSSAATEGAEAVRDSLRSAFEEIRKAVLETTHKIAS